MKLCVITWIAAALQLLLSPAQVRRTALIYTPLYTLIRSMDKLVALIKRFNRSNRGSSVNEAGAYMHVLQSNRVTFTRLFTAPIRRLSVSQSLPGFGLCGSPLCIQTFGNVVPS